MGFTWECPSCGGVSLSPLQRRAHVCPAAEAPTEEPATDDSTNYIFVTMPNQAAGQEQLVLTDPYHR